MTAPIPGIGGIAATSQVQAPQKTADGFRDGVQRALDAVSDAERVADAKVQDVAAGGDTSVHELMVATTKASLNVELLVQMRNKAVEAYQEIMRMQV